ncbi:MAG: MFS transporter [Gammaproteobacteria bacterium]|nr:MAG: MFS transporter [Gammaproteobacteria bacterium]
MDSKTRNQFSLLTQRRFGPFFATQFLGAFNDNVFKNALLILIAFQVVGVGSSDSNTSINLAAGIFILPFFLFSASAGQLADKYEKSFLIRLIKLFEISIMICAAVGLYLRSVPFLIGVLFLMGTQSALFGPVKYGILPQLLGDDELIGGNGLVGMGTFMAILLGTMAGGLLVGIPDGGTIAVGMIVVTVACMGYWVSRSIPPVPTVDPSLKVNWNALTETWRIIQFTRQSRTVFLSVIGISWFWFFGATYLAQFPNFTRVVLHGNEQVVTLLLALFSVGVGVGSLFCERLSGRMVELGLVPFGSIGLTVFGIDIFFAVPDAGAGELVGAIQFLQAPGSWRVSADVILIGLFGGFYVVPLYALVQQRSKASHRSRIIAGNNVLNALFMLMSAVMAISVLAAGLSIPELFLLTAVLNGLVAIYIYTVVPEFLMRFIVWILIHTVYRIRKEGLERIPERGPAILACNHVSYVDALVIAGCVRRPIRFVMYHKIFQIPLLRFVFRTAGAIPIASRKENPELLERAFEQIADSLQKGQLVCIFPEGRITRDGALNVFRPGLERIVQRNPVPVIPIALRGLADSLFARGSGRSLRNFPWLLWAEIALIIGMPVAPEAATAGGVREAVAGLLQDPE